MQVKENHIFEMHPTKDNRQFNVRAWIIIWGRTNWIEMNRSTQPIESSNIFHMISKLIPILLHLNLMHVTVVCFASLFLYWLLMFFFLLLLVLLVLALLFLFVSLLVFFLHHSYSIVLGALQFRWNRSNNMKKNKIKQTNKHSERENKNEKAREWKIKIHRTICIHVYFINMQCAHYYAGP